MKAWSFSYNMKTDEDAEQERDIGTGYDVDDRHSKDVRSKHSDELVATRRDEDDDDEEEEVEELYTTLVDLIKKHNKDAKEDKSLHITPCGADSILYSDRISMYRETVRYTLASHPDGLRTHELCPSSSIY